MPLQYWPLQIHFHSPDDATLLAAVVVAAEVLFSFARQRHFIGRCTSSRCFICIHKRAPFYLPLQ